jgi:hypothetical protein
MDDCAEQGRTAGYYFVIESETGFIAGGGVETISVFQYFCIHDFIPDWSSPGLYNHEQKVC